MEVSFSQWLPYGLPVTLVMLPIAYLVLLTLFPVGNRPLAGGRDLILSELKQLGQMKRPEWIVLAVFLLTVALWMSSKSLSKWQLQWAGQSYEPLALLTDEAVAMAASFLLFIIPAGAAAIHRQDRQDACEVNSN